jgi:hypothetical protein
MSTFYFLFKPLLLPVLYKLSSPFDLPPSHVLNLSICVYFSMPTLFRSLLSLTLAITSNYVRIVLPALDS